MTHLIILILISPVLPLLPHPIDPFYLSVIVEIPF